EPRRTVRHLVDTDPDNSVMLLAGLNGLATALIQAITRGAGARFPVGTILTAAAVAGPLMGIVALQFYSVLLGWTGRLFGGAAPFRQIRTTVAWAEAPIVATLGLLIPATLVLRRALFALGAAAPVVALPLLLVTGVSGAWGLVIGTQGLAGVGPAASARSVRQHPTFPYRSNPWTPSHTCRFFSRSLLVWGSPRS